MLLKRLNKNWLLITCLSFISTFVIHGSANSQTWKLPQSSQAVPDSLVVAQVAERINFNSNYYETLKQADRYYQQGDKQAAKQLQQRVKPNFTEAKNIPPAKTELSQIDSQGQKYWQTATKAIKDDPLEAEAINSLIFDPLTNLIANYPEFVPGHILLADTHDLYGERKEALAVISNAAEMYLDREDILDTKIDLLLLYGKPLEASIAARQYAYNNPDSPKAAAYETAAEGYFKKYQKKLKRKITASGILGVAGQVATGNQAGGLQIGQMLLAGENTAGQSFSQSIKSQSKMVSDKRQLKYLNDIGQRLAKLMGRDEFTYEFNIVDDPTPNAFALPGGKIFFHTGMLELMDSEAELAGVLAHEIAHSVLSHSYERIGESALTNTAANLLSSIVGREAGFAAQLGEGLLGKKI